MTYLHTVHGKHWISPLTLKTIFLWLEKCDSVQYVVCSGRPCIQSLFGMDISFHPRSLTFPQCRSQSRLNRGGSCRERSAGFLRTSVTSGPPFPGFRHCKFIWTFYKVSKPNISCEMINASKATLVCSAECNCPHLLKFKWHSQGKKWAGPNLTITLINEDDDQVYQCGVSNPLTNETSTFTAKDCFQEQTPAPVIYRWDDMGGFWVSFITIFMIGFTTGYMVRRKFRCSECFQAIKKRRHKRKQNKRTGETAAFEKSPPLLDQGQQSKAKPRQEHYHPPPPKKKATSCHSDTGTQKLSHPLPLILNNY
ncbi:uncharacterized protein LOC133512560 isoform X5 [Syngnathoides biaculeatus]|uniref:uncharacterized protein LOC133512560 isoform X5 n=1 Tax=Syngnathoides biaculeatus TaxID=300417 RepID=UPI002ADE274B|nr:uncharacterized protein LOC133512560 isoform X5 [Syngnathoides biaculeatus]